MTPQLPFASSFGVAALAAWLLKHDVSVAAFARALGVPRSSATSWLRGAYRPDAASREAIAKFTRGEVPANVWLMDDERAQIAAVVPYEPPPAAAASPT